jgi:hypothetical protein
MEQAFQARRDTDDHPPRHSKRRSDDLKAARGFCTDLLGFEVAMDELGSDVCLAEQPNGAGILVARKGAMDDPMARESRMSVEVADVDTVMRRLRRMAVRSSIH